MNGFLFPFTIFLVPFTQLFFEVVCRYSTYGIYVSLVALGCFGSKRVTTLYSVNCSTWAISVDICFDPEQKRLGVAFGALKQLQYFFAEVIS